MKKLHKDPLFIRIGVVALFFAIILTVYLAMQEQNLRQEAKGKGGGKPNIILILTDDQRYDTLKYMPKTERLLGKQGVTFTNAFATTPLCCPSRVSILTGKYTQDHGILTNHEKYKQFKDKDTLPVWLQKAGYRTGLMGKYLNIFKEKKYVPPGWDDFRADIKNTYYGYTMNENGQDITYGYDPQDYSTYVFTEMAINFIEGKSDPLGKNKKVNSNKKNDVKGGQGAKSNKPFLVILSTNAVHTDGGKTIFKKGSGGNGKKGKTNAASVDTDEEVDVTEEELESHFQGANDENEIESDDSLLDAAGGAKKMKDYFAMPGPKDARKCKPIKDFERIPSFNEKDVSDKPKTIRDIPRWSNNEIRKLEAWAESQVCALKAVDDAVEDIVKSLGKERDNTVIIYMSDNGYAWGENRWSRKACVYDSCAKVPLIISYPKMTKKKEESNALVKNEDIAATIADLATAKTGKIDGISLVPILKNPDKTVQDVILLEVYNYGDSFAVRTEKYLYVENQSCELELYDLKKDPYNLDNQIENEKYYSDAQKLQKELEKLKKGKLKNCKLPEPKDKKNVDQRRDRSLKDMQEIEGINESEEELDNIDEESEEDTDTVDGGDEEELTEEDIDEKTVRFSLTAFLHGIGRGGDALNPQAAGNTNPRTTEYPFLATIYAGEEVIDVGGTVRYDSAKGAFTGSFSAVIPDAENITLEVEIPRYLTTTAEIDTLPDSGNVTLPELSFVNGDVNNDYVLDILDFNLIAACFSQNDGEICDPKTRKQSDLDDNGIVGEPDVNLYLRELSAKDY